MMRAIVLAAALWGLWPGAQAVPQRPPLVPEASPEVRQVLALTNRERLKAGLPALRLDPELSRAAQAHAEDMARRRYLSHLSPEGERVPARIARTSFGSWTACGENIAAGQPTAAEAVAAWMESPGHRANILSAWYAEMGVGVVYDPAAPYVRYWVQVFARAAGDGGVQ